MAVDRVDHARPDVKRRAAAAATPLAPALAGEMIGTFVLVFFGVGVVNAAVVTGAQMGLWQVAVVWAIGVSLGIAAGYFGGRVDQLVGYLLTCQLALPTLLLAMALVFLIGWRWYRALRASARVAVARIRADTLP